MKILVYMGHPAHFYLYKNTIQTSSELKESFAAKVVQMVESGL